MQLPSLEKWLEHGKKLWDLATPTNRKIFFPNITSWNAYKKILTENWKRLKDNPSVFEEETKRTERMLKEGLKRLDDSQKNHDKAMSQVEEKEYEESQSLLSKK